MTALIQFAAIRRLADAAARAQNDREFRQRHTSDWRDRDITRELLAAYHELAVTPGHCDAFEESSSVARARKAVAELRSTRARVAADIQATFGDDQPWGSARVLEGFDERILAAEGAYADAILDLWLGTQREDDLAKQVEHARITSLLERSLERVREKHDTERPSSLDGAAE